ncbi:MAG: SPASM domain-containing protein, partial [Thermotogota bacterium]|nr:SPASM domain-containing protein [Thermotogota bacterium]
TKDPCRLLWTDMVINWNGDVPLCCNDYERGVCLGNIKESSIKDIWGGLKLQNMREFHEKREFNKIKICNNCEYNYHDKSNWWTSK